MTAGFRLVAVERRLEKGEGMAQGTEQLHTRKSAVDARARDLEEALFGS